MPSIELRKCPFCHEDNLAHVELSNGLHYIECKRCGASPHRIGAWSYEAAAKIWNGLRYGSEENGCWISCEMCANTTCQNREVKPDDP